MRFDYTDINKIIREMEKRTKEMENNPELARKYLQELGTHDKYGNLTPEYGGMKYKQIELITTDMYNGNGHPAPEHKKRNYIQPNFQFK